MIPDRIDGQFSLFLCQRADPHSFSPSHSHHVFVLSFPGLLPRKSGKGFGVSVQNADDAISGGAGETISGPQNFSPAPPDTHPTPILFPSTVRGKKRRAEGFGRGRCPMKAPLEWRNSRSDFLRAGRLGELGKGVEGVRGRKSVNSGTVGGLMGLSLASPALH
jgi:hypothetical protein